jgi:Family of unknown function (DUF5343)
MALSNAYVLPTNRLADFFSKIRDGQPPARFTVQHLKDWGFKSTNDRPFIPLLKALGFLTPDGAPTPRYSAYRDHTRSKAVLGEALKEAYGDLFLIKENPTNSAADKAAIQGKFKSFYNISDSLATYMMRSFMALLPLADLTGKAQPKPPTDPDPTTQRREERKDEEDSSAHHIARSRTPGLHYNIEIHLPATKDVEVYNAIFKSLREHIIGK